MYNKKNIFIYVLLLSLIFNTISYSQNYNLSFEHYSVDQGLSQSSVLSICQDSKGFLWIGTEDGLNKFDGYEFIIYKNDPNDSTTLGDNRVNCIVEDKNGSIWVGTSGGGLNRFNPVNEKFYRYVNNTSDSNSISNNIVASILEDKLGNLFVGTLGGGLNLFNPQTEKFKRFVHNLVDKKSISNNIVYSILEDHQDQIWVATWGGLNKFDRRLNQFSCYKHNPNDILSISNDKVFTIYEDNQNNLWAGTWGGGLNKFIRQSENFVRYVHDKQNVNSINNNIVLAINEDKTGNFWVGTFGGGLNLFDPVKNQVKHFMNKTDDPYSLSNDRVYRIFVDNIGLIWIGTVGGGFNKLDRKKQYFNHYKHSANNINSLSDNGVFAFCEDNPDVIWIGTYGGGLNKFNTISNTFEHFTHNPKDPGSLSNDGVSSICKRSSNELWIGTFGGGLNKYNRIQKDFSHFKHDNNDPYSLSDDRVSVIFEDRLETLWIGTLSGGLNRFDDKTKQFYCYKNIPDDTSSLSHNRIYSIFEDNTGHIWIGTFGGGLNKFDRETGKFIRYKHNSKDQFSLSNDKIYSIYEDKSGFLWIGTVGGGLNKFDRTEGRFFHFREKDGLSNDVIYGILEDAKGNLWLSTNKGLSRFNIASEKFRNYDVNNGLQHNEFNQGAYLKSTAGELFFGGINGFNTFYPDSITIQKEVPDVVITDFQLMNKPVSIGYDSTLKRTILTKSITNTDLIELNYDDYIFSFEFSALDYRNPQKNKYAYKLEGFSDQWTYTDAERRFVTYTNLDPGSYFFRVKGSNSDGIWNDNTTSVKIFIYPPWWATWWSYILYGVMFVLIIFSIRQYDLRRQKLKHQLELEHEHAEKLEEIDRMKSHFFTNISHEFRTPLTLILGPADNILSSSMDENVGKQTKLIKKYTHRLLGLVNQLLDLSKLEAGKLKLNASRGNIASFLKGVSMTFEPLAMKKDIRFKVKVQKHIIEAFFDKDKMEKIITNLLSNAFKFTFDGGEILVSLITTDDNSVKIVFRDTGVGISKMDLPFIFERFFQADSSQSRLFEGTGVGLALTKELVELHKGKIDIESKEGEWTKVTIELPLGSNHLNPTDISDKDEVEKYEIKFEPDDFATSKHIDDDFIDEKIEKNIILLVEDNPDVREYVKDSLLNEYKILEASNGEQGFRKAEKMIPDLIVSDVMMPIMDGIEMLRKLKSDAITCHIPIILLTAKSEHSDKLEGITTGAEGYITKPFDIKELKVRIKSLIEQRKILQRKFIEDGYLIKNVEKSLSVLDQEFLQMVTSVINVHLSEEEFSIEQFGKEAGMSRSQIHRKLKAITGKSPSLYVRSIRLNKARQMIQNKEATISEISYKVGFSSPAYFSRCFREEFGYSPSELPIN